MLNFNRNKLNIHRASWWRISVRSLMSRGIRTMSSRVSFVSLSASAGVAFSLSVFATEPIPRLTGEFLAFCKANSKECFNKIGDISFAQLANSAIERQQRWCPADEPDDLEILVPKVVEWLNEHPEVRQM